MIKTESDPGSGLSSLRSSALHSYAIPTSQGSAAGTGRPRGEPRQRRQSVLWRCKQLPQQPGFQRNAAKANHLGDPGAGPAIGLHRPPLPIARCGKPIASGRRQAATTRPSVQGLPSRLLPSPQQCFSFLVNDNLSQGSLFLISLRN